MNLKLLLLLLATTASITTFGQVSNNIFIGLNSFISGQNKTYNEKLTSSGFNNGATCKSTKKTLTITTIPQIGYKIDENKRVGLGFGFQRSQEKEKLGIDEPNPFNIYNRTNSYFVRALYIQDIKITNRVNFLLQANFDFLKEREKRETYDNQSYGQQLFRSYYFNPNLVPGMRTVLNNKIELEVSYGSVGYFKGKLIAGSGNSETNYDSEKFDVDFTIKKLTLGIKYYLKSKSN